MILGCETVSKSLGVSETIPSPPEKHLGLFKRKCQARTTRSVSARCLGSASRPLADTAAWCPAVSFPGTSSGCRSPSGIRADFGECFRPEAWTWEVLLRLDVLLPGLILVSVAPSLLPVGRMILARGSSNISQCSDSCPQLGQGWQDVSCVPLTLLEICWFGQMAVRQHAGHKPELGTLAVPLRLLVCGGVRGERCRGAVCLMSRAQVVGLAQAQGCAQNHRFTESQNSRGWKGPLWVTQSNPPAEAGSPTAGCRGPCPGGA